MRTFKFYYGPMSSGKSTMALQTAHTLELIGEKCLLLTMHDRSGKGLVTSRIGAEKEAIEINGGHDLMKLIEQSGCTSVVCDEVQFYLHKQVDQLARVVDKDVADVFAFGLLADFQTKMFHGTKRCFELADETHRLQLEVRCWCGSRATHNARTKDGDMITEGSQVVVGDVNSNDIGYELLCRKHYMSKETKKKGLV